MTVGQSLPLEEDQSQMRMRSDEVHDQFDVSLEDSDLLGEVELTTNLIIAASESDDRLSEDQIDADPGRGARARQRVLRHPARIYPWGVWSPA